MSTIAELARAEGDAAEHENPDAELDDDPESDDDPEPAPAEPAEPPSDVSMETALKAMESEAKRHEKAVAKIMGDGWEDVYPCPCCQLGPGFVFPFVTTSPDDQERKATVERYFGADDPPLRDAPYAETCATCAGYGQLKMGALNAHNSVLPCRDCDGRGWKEKLTSVAALPPLAAAPFPGADVTYMPVEGGQVDAWGRPAGHPHWGTHPSLIGG